MSGKAGRNLEFPSLLRDLKTLLLIGLATDLI